MGIDHNAVGKALKQELTATYPVRDDITGEVVSDPDGFPIAELHSDDYLELADTMTIEERSMGERAWRFGHVIVDEAQDLTPMQWRMIARRARGHSMTIVGDVAQRTTGEPGTWETLLPPEFGEIKRFDLSTNYRSPEEIEGFANRVLHELDPTLRAPVSIRQSGHPVTIHHLTPGVASHVPPSNDGVAPHVPPSNDGEEGVAPHHPRSEALLELATDLLSEIDGGRLAVITTAPFEIDHHQIRCLTPSASKGMEFDAVIVDEPAEILDCSHGLGLLYVALTRATDRLVIVHDRPLPPLLTR